MYTPPQHVWSDQGSILAFCQAHPFATVVTTGPAGPEAQHLPLLVDVDRDGLILHGHAALRNPVWQASHALVVFHGPHAYVSAAWYDEDNTVPTWNYLAVHASGPLSVVEDSSAIRQLFARLAQPDPQAAAWQVRLDATTYAHLTHGLRWFRIAATTVQGKAKLSQHHSAEQQQAAARYLLASPDPESQAVGKAMRRVQEREQPWEVSSSGGQPKQVESRRLV